MNVRISRAGLTLVEVLVAFSLSILVVGTLSTFFTSGVRSMARAEERLDPREALFTIDLTLRGWIQGANSCSILPGGDGLTYEGRRGRGQVRYDASRRTVSFRSDAHGVLQFAHVTAFKLSLRNGRLLVLDIELSGKNGRFSFTDGIQLRDIPSPERVVAWNTPPVGLR
jgi:type II secretory pathway component PulJ